MVLLRAELRDAVPPAVRRELPSLKADLLAELPPAAPSGGFSFTPPAASGDSPKFSFGAPPDVSDPAAAPTSNFTFNFAAPPPAGGGGGGGKGGKPPKGKPSAADDMDDDDDAEEVDTSTMAKSGLRMGGGQIPAELQKRLERLNMSADQRRQATMDELPAEVLKVSPGTGSAATYVRSAATASLRTRVRPTASMRSVLPRLIGCACDTPCASLKGFRV